MDPNQPQYKGPGPANFGALSMGRKLALGGAIVLFIAYFLPWYSIDIGFGVGSVSANGVTGVGALNLIILLFIIAAAGMPAMGKSIKNFVPVAMSEGTMIFFGGIVVAVLVVLSVISNLGGGVGPGIGLIIGVVATIATVAGGWLMKQAGE